MYDMPANTVYNGKLVGILCDRCGQAVKQNNITYYRGKAYGPDCIMVVTGLFEHEIESLKKINPKTKQNFTAEEIMEYKTKYDAYLKAVSEFYATHVAAWRAEVARIHELIYNYIGRPMFLPDNFLGQMVNRFRLNGSDATYWPINISEKQASTLARIIGDDGPVNVRDMEINMNEIKPAAPVMGE